MKKESAYKLVNGIGVTANTVSFFFLHNPLISVALKAVSAGCNLASARMHKTQQDKTAVSVARRLALWDAASACITCTDHPGAPDAAIIANTFVGYCQGIAVHAGLHRERITTLYKVT